MGYRPALDGVRGIAIAAVVSLHTFGWPRQGALGVDLFFVLSGFLITMLLLERKGSIRAFYERRARRLLPALFAMLAVYTVAIMLSGHAGGLLAVLMAVLYGSNLFALAGGHVPPSLGHLWSLAQEEQFYLVWPALLLLLRGPRLAKILIVLITAVAVERLALALSGQPLMRIYLGPDTHAEPILTGSLFAVWYAQGQLRRISGALSIAALAGLIGGFLFLSPLFRILYATPLLTLFACLCALVTVDAAIGTSTVARLLAVRPLRFLGEISYSLYLWHIPILAAFGAVALASGWLSSLLALTIATLLATASRYFVEQPFLRQRVSGSGRIRVAAAPAVQAAQP